MQVLIRHTCNIVIHTTWFILLHINWTLHNAPWSIYYSVKLHGFRNLNLKSLIRTSDSCSFLFRAPPPTSTSTQYDIHKTTAKNGWLSRSVLRLNLFLHMSASSLVSPPLRPHYSFAIHHQHIIIFLHTQIIHSRISLIINSCFRLTLKLKNNSTIFILPAKD